MNILHIACITNSKYSGVCVVVPEHIRAQSKLANVGFINIDKEIIDGLDCQINCPKPFKLEYIKAPFNKPDIVIFHEAYRSQYLSISKELRKNKIPYIIIPHGELNEEAQQKKHLKKVMANILLFNKFINGAVAIQCLSDREMNSTHFGRSKFIGTNGINIPEAKKGTFSTEGIKFVYIGRLDAYHKGLDLLIAAVKKERNFLKENKCLFSLYGPEGGNNFQNLVHMVEEAGVSDVITVNHAVSGNEKEKVLLEADVFIQTSRFEGMPMGILEAMSYGLPCLVTEGTTLGSYVEKHAAGWQASTDVDSISMCIKQSINQKNALALFSANAIKGVNSDFSWDVISENTIRTYRKFIK